MLLNDMDTSLSSGYKDFLWAVELNRIGLEMIGLWPKNDKFAKNYLWSELRANIILILLIFVCNVPTICAIMQVWGDMVLLINNLQTTIPFVTVVIKYIIMRCKRTVLLSTVNMMAEDWMTFKLDIERDVMIKRAQTVRLIIIIAYIFTLTGILVMIIRPYFGIQTSHVTNFTNWEKYLPLQTYNFYDTNKSPQFELTFFIHIITMVSAATIYISIDIFLMLSIFHICGQLENFRYRLIRLILCKNFNKALSDIITRHLRLIRFANNIENTYSLIMLIVILHFGIVFCLSSFLCITVFTDRIEGGVIIQVFSLIVILTLLMDILFYCGAGEFLEEECNAVRHAMCDLKWYKLEPKEARNLILLMIRINHPFYITAGRIVPLTMPTFCNVLKTSSGYISFLLTIHG